MKCSACNVEMETLIPGIFQCPQCKKIIKEKSIDVEKKEAESTIGTFLDGEWFHKNVSLNKTYEIALICKIL